MSDKADKIEKFVKALQEKNLEDGIALFKSVLAEGVDAAKLTIQEDVLKEAGFTIAEKKVDEMDDDEDKDKDDDKVDEAFGKEDDDDDKDKDKDDDDDDDKDKDKDKDDD